MYKSQISRIFALFALLAMLSGCGEKEITGQIFVVTQGKDNIKMALVTVGAIPQEEFDQFLKAKQSKRIEQQKTLLPKYEEAKSDLKWSNGKIQWYNYLLKDAPLINLTEKLRKHYQGIIKDLAAAEVAIAKDKAVIAEYEAFDKAEFLFEGLPTPKVITKTDADGKFTLKLPSGKYVITANSSREVFGSTETYHWLVTVGTSNINQPLMLSNDNLLETKCNECVKY